MLRFEQYLQQHLSVEPEAYKRTLAAFAPRVLKRGALFQASGEPCEHLAYIADGVMRNFTQSEDGTEEVRYLTSDGHFNTNYPAFALGQQSPESINAVTDCHLYVIDRRAFLQLMDSCAPFRHLTDQVVAEGIACQAERLRAFASDQAQTRYEFLLEQHPKVVQHASVRDIASYLGVQRETLSRIRRRTQRAHK